MKYPKALSTLISNLQKFPGVGKKTAERYAFDLTSWPVEDINTFANNLSLIKKRLVNCQSCRALLDAEESNRCKYCDLSKRDGKSLCILSSQKDLFAIEGTHMYLGLYHILDGLLSPLNNFSTKNLDLESVKKRIRDLNITEVILALDSTIEGDATSLFLKKELATLGLKISRLALGIPIGSSLDFIDGGTLSKALSERTLF